MKTENEWQEAIWCAVTDASYYGCFGPLKNITAEIIEMQKRAEQAVKADAQRPCLFCEHIGPNALGGNYCFNCGRCLRTA